MRKEETILSLKEVSLSYDGRKVLERVDLELKTGQSLALFGENGSGKTSLLRVIAGLVKEGVEGELLFSRQDLKELKIDERARLGVGFIYQNPPTINHVSLRALFNNIPGERPRNLEIEGFLDRGVGVGLSGGERKRVELSQMIALNPKLWLIDEIDAGLDSRNLQKIGRLLAEILVGKTAIIVSHNLRIFDFLRPELAAMMKNGRLERLGAFEDIRKELE